MKKRLLSMLLVLVMVIGLLPTAAMAADATIVSTNSDANVDVTKSALPNGDGTYDITITVTPNTEGVAKPLELVLLLDVSGSMAWCTQEDHKHNRNCNQLELICGMEQHWHDLSCGFGLWCDKKEHWHSDSCYTYSCGKHEHRNGGVACAGVTVDKLPSRLESAVTAASSLVDTLVTKGLYAKVSIVTFSGSSSARTVLAQQPVTNVATAEIVTDRLDDLEANGGTYMEPGVELAADQFSNDPDTHKVLVMLADGDNDSDDDETIEAAEGMKNAGVDIYTIAFTKGIDIMEQLRANDGTYSVAGDETALSGIFAAIANDMTAKLTDSMGSYVDLVGTVTAGSGSASVSGDTITWQLATLQKDVPQTLTYRVAVDVDALNVGENTIPLNGSVGLTYKLGTDEKTVSVTPPQDKVYVGRLTEKIFVDGTEVTAAQTVGRKVLITGSETFTWNAPAATYNGATYVETKYDGVATTATSESATSGEHVVAHYYSSGYTLTYDVNGGNPDGPKQVSNLSAQNNYPLNTTTKPSHDPVDGVPVLFVGWTAKPDTKIYAKNETAPACIETVNIEADTIVYAVYGYDTNDDDIPDVLQDWVTVTKIFKGITADEVATLTNFKLYVANSDGVVKTLTLDGATLDPKEKNPTYTWEFPLATGNYIISESRKDVKLELYTLTVKDADKKIISVGVDVFTQNFTVEENSASSIVFQNAYTLKNTFTLTYDANGGTGAPAAESVTAAKESAEFTISTTKPTREGYTFLGWSEDENAITAQVFTDNKIAVTAADGYSKTLYAVWSRDEGTLTVTKTFTGLDAGETLPDVTITVKNATGSVVATLTNKDKTGFTASGNTYTWNVTVPTDTYTVEETAVPAIPGYLVNANGSTVKAENVAVTLNGGSASLTNAYTKVNNGLEVSKSVDHETAKVGDTLTYTITVKNAGNVAQKNVAVKDTMTGAKGTISFKETANVTYFNGVFTIKNLAVGATETITYTYKVLEADKGATIKNGVEVENDITGDDDTEVLVENGALKVVKTVDKTTAKVGDKLTYTVTVTNTGNTTLYRIELTDAMLNVTETIDALRPGASWTKSYEYTVKTADAGKTIVNTAVAKASDGTTGSGSSEGTKVQSTQTHVPTLNKKDHVAYIIGYEDNTVRPENNITRAEVATIFFRLLTDDSRARFWSQTNDFSDVSANDWFNNAVSTMANAGILTGYPDGTFKPNAPITRAEFAAIAARFSDVTYNGKCSFTDVAATYWAADEIALAEHLGWITGYPDDTFRPSRNITRAEAMTLINRVLERAVEEEHMLKNMVKWIDNSPNAWYYEAVQEATNSHTYTRLSKKVPGQSFYYEDWVAILENPDWAALERAWSKANDQ